MEMHARMVTDCPPSSIDIAFALDSSSSIQADRWQNITNFVVDIVNQLDFSLNTINIGVISWSSVAVRHIRFNDGLSQADTIQVAVYIIIIFS